MDPEKAITPPISPDPKYDVNEKHSDTNVATPETNHHATLSDEVGWRGYAIVALASFMYLADTTAQIGFGSNARYMTADVGGTTLTPWVSTSLSATVAILAPINCYVADIIGRRPVMLFCVCFGIVGTIIAGTAHSFGQLIAGVVCCSVASSSVGIALAISSELLPHRLRAWAQGIPISCAFFSGLLGLPAVGTAVQNNVGGGWRLIFWILCAMWGSCLPCWIFLYNPRPRPNPEHLPTLTRIKRLDWPGYGLLAVGLVTFIMGLTWGPLQGWGSAHFIAPFVIGITTLIIFALWEIKGTSTGLFHHGLFVNRNFPITCALIAVEGVFFGTHNQYYSTETNILYTTNAVTVGWRSIPFWSMVAGGMPLWALYSTRFRDVRTPILAGLLMFIGAGIGYTFLTPYSGSLALGMNALGGLAWSGPGVYAITIMQLSIPPALIGTGTGLLVSCRNLGAAMGTAGSGALYNAKVASTVPPAVAQAAIDAGLPSTSVTAFTTALIANNAKALANIPGLTPEILSTAQLTLKYAYASVFKNLWEFILGFLAVAFIVCCFLKNPGKNMNDLIDAPLATAHVEESHIVHDEEANRVEI